MIELIDLNTLDFQSLPMFAGIWGAIASAAGSVLSGIMGQDAQEDATEAQLEAQRLAIDEQRRQFDTIRELNEPFRQSNLRAMRAQEDLLGLGGMGGGGGSVGGGGGPASQIPDRQSGTMPRRRDPGQYEVPGGGGVRQGIPGITAPEPSLDDRFRNRRISNQEELINNLAGSPENRRQLLRQQIEAGNIDPNNPFIQNIFRRIGG